MRISLSEKDKSCFYKLLEIKDNNIEISNLLLTSFAYTDFIDINKLRNRISNENEETAIKNIILDNFEVDSIEYFVIFQIFRKLLRNNRLDFEYHF